MEGTRGKMRFLTTHAEASAQQTLCSLKGTFLIPVKRNLFLTAVLSVYASNTVLFFIPTWESIRALSCFLKQHVPFALCFPKSTCRVGWQTQRQNQLLCSFSG